MQNRTDSQRMTLALQQANRILKGLTNCQIEFVADDRLINSEWGSSQLDMLRNSERIDSAQLIVESESGSKFAIAVRDQNGFAGLAVISGWQGVRDARMNDLTNLLTTVIERALNEESDVDDNVQILDFGPVYNPDQNADDRADFAADFSASNIADFHSEEELESRLENIQKIIEVLEADERTSAFQTQMNPVPLLIETRGAVDAHRIAVEIHETSGRWAMLSLESLDQDILKSRESLKELGAITLFIPSLGALTVEQQNDLISYLATQPSREMPQVIAGLEVSIASDRFERLVKMFCLTRIPWNQISAEGRVSNAEIAQKLMSGALMHRQESSNQVLQENVTMSSRVFDLSAKRRNHLLH